MTECSRSADDSPPDRAGAFRLVSPKVPRVPILLAVPHAGRSYPDEVVGNMRYPRESMLKLEDRLVDRVAEDLAELTGASLLVAHTPRAVIDLNRSTEDVDWEMVRHGARPKARHSLINRRSRSGLGLVPRRLPVVGEIWRGPIEAEELEQRIEAVHRPYHNALATELEQLRDRWGAALLLDLHSMPPLPVRHAGERPAEFVIGDRFGSSCDAMISARALSYLGAEGRPVAHNRPYSGGYVLERHGVPKRDIHAMQLEICRSTYLDNRYEELSARLPAVVRSLAGLVRVLAYEVCHLGSGNAMPMAAE